MLRIHSEELLRAFHTMSGMEISVLDRDFHTVFMVKSTGEAPCAEIHRHPSTIDLCKASDVEHLSVARSELRPVLYTCPFGLTEAIVPILRDDTPIGYLFSMLGIERETEADALARCAAHGDAFPPCLRQARRLSSEEHRACLQILTVLADELARDGTLAEGRQSIGQLSKRYIKNNLSRKLSLGDVSKHLHCSTVTLTEHFRHEFGITVNEYVTKKRMELAEKLLLTTDAPLSEIAASCGFSDTEYFSRTFKRHHGTPPAGWRRKQRKMLDGDVGK